MARGLPFDHGYKGNANSRPSMHQNVDKTQIVAVLLASFCCCTCKASVSLGGHTLSA